MEDAMSVGIETIVSEIKLHPFNMDGLPFDADQREWNRIVSLDRSGGAHQPATVACTKLHHDETVLCSLDGGEEVDPLEVFLRKFWGIRPLIVCLRKIPLDVVPLGSKELLVLSRTQKVYIDMIRDAPGPMLGISEYAVMFDHFSLWPGTTMRRMTGLSGCPLVATG